jgi:hypothetical protein
MDRHWTYSYNSPKKLMQNAQILLVESMEIVTTQNFHQSLLLNWHKTRLEKNLHFDNTNKFSC